MKTKMYLLVNKHSLWYLTEAGQWTDDIDKAIKYTQFDTACRVVSGMGESAKSVIHIYEYRAVWTVESITELQ